MPKKQNGTQRPTDRRDGLTDRIGSRSNRVASIHWSIFNENDSEWQAPMLHVYPHLFLPEPRIHLEYFFVRVQINAHWRNFAENFDGARTD